MLAAPHLSKLLQQPGPTVSKSVHAALGKTEKTTRSSRRRRTVVSGSVASELASSLAHSSTNDFRPCGRSLSMVGASLYIASGVGPKHPSESVSTSCPDPHRSNVNGDRAFHL